MTGKRPVRRSLDKPSRAFQDNPSVHDSSSSGSVGSSGLQSNSWYLRNSGVACSRNSTTSSSQISSAEERQENGRDSSGRGQRMFITEVIERTSSTSTFSSSLSCASLKRKICSIPSLLILTIFCLPEYLLKACICVKDHMTMKSFMFFSVAISAIGAAIYCSCLCRIWSDVLSSKELAQQYETELKSLGKSQNVLEEKIHEIQDLKKQISRLHAEINGIKEGILHSVEQILKDADIPGENKEQLYAMINLAFKKIYEDHVQMADWALKSIGATIDTERTSPSYDPDNMPHCWFRFLLMSSANPPDTILEPDVYPGNCWAFQGSEGQVVVKLPEKIQPTFVTVQHISKAVSPSGGVTSALKDFMVYGLDDGTEKETLLGQFIYDIEKEFIQTFQLKNEDSKQFQFIKFKVLSNWGNPEYTCIYRVRVHGKMIDYLRPLNETRLENLAK